MLAFNPNIVVFVDCAETVKGILPTFDTRTDPNSPVVFARTSFDIWRGLCAQVIFAGIITVIFADVFVFDVYTVYVPSYVPDKYTLGTDKVIVKFVLLPFVRLTIDDGLKDTLKSEHTGPEVQLKYMSSAMSLPIDSSVMLELALFPFSIINTIGSSVMLSIGFEPIVTFIEVVKLSVVLS